MYGKNNKKKDNVIYSVVNKAGQCMIAYFPKFHRRENPKAFQSTE